MFQLFSYPPIFLGNVDGFDAVVAAELVEDGSGLIADGSV